MLKALFVLPLKALVCNALLGRMAVTRVLQQSGYVAEMRWREVGVGQPLIDALRPPPRDEKVECLWNESTNDLLQFATAFVLTAFSRNYYVRVYARVAVSHLQHHNVKMSVEPAPQTIISRHVDEM